VPDRGSARAASDQDAAEMPWKKPMIEEGRHVRPKPKASVMRLTVSLSTKQIKRPHENDFIMGANLIDCSIARMRSLDH
jgi:hypothetical protein